MNKPLYFVVIIFIFSLIVLIYFLTRSEERDEIRYKTLLNLSRTAASTSPFGAKQERTSVYKQAFINKEGLRHTISLECPKSEIALTSNSELIEKFEDVQCHMQERLFFDEQQKPMQEIKQLKTKSAIFSYQDHLFKGEDVHLSEFKCKGHELTYNPKASNLLMKGRAKEAEFTLQNDLQFKANGLKATFYND